MIPEQTVAVKTGTTNLKRDNWTVGWTPGVNVGVWVGNNDNTPMKEVASGVTGASPIWRRIILAALKNLPKEDFYKPEGLVEMDIDKISGYGAHDGFEARREIFVDRTQPEGEDPVHKKIKVCKGEGKLATPADVGSGNYEEKEAFYFSEKDPFTSNWQGANKWQEGINAWLTTMADPKYHPPTDYCGSTNPLWITIVTPGERSQTGSDVNVKIEISDLHQMRKVEVYLDGNLKQSFSGGESPWEITLPDLVNGYHKIDVRAEDEKGNQGTRYVEFGVNQPWDLSPTPTP
jgi:membrane carboxypeptidase/penicillin-binding protein PbpC